MASFSIGYAGGIIRKILSKKFMEETVLNLTESTGKGLLWFLAILISLSIIGFSEIAAALGTAAGFFALGVVRAEKCFIRYCGRLLPGEGSGFQQWRQGGS
jgi:hypothetical protein